MNWEIFSSFGYLSVALWACIPLCWVAHLLIRPRRWIGHVPLVLGAAALVFATINSRTHVSRIQVDQSERIAEQMSAAALARQQAEAERAAEAADIRFAEDAAGDQLDKAGLDDTDLAYFESFGDDTSPAWRQEKQTRNENASDSDDLQALIGATAEREGVDVEGMDEPERFEPILMSEADQLRANRLDDVNLTATRLMLFLAFVFVAFDYVRRLNVDRESYYPLPLPSAWADAMSPRPAVSKRSGPPSRSLLETCRYTSRRGESFLLLTDDARLAAEAEGAMPRLPMSKWPIEALNPRDDEKLDNEFVFESLWFTRNSFVIDDTERALPLLEDITARLRQRRASRARVRQAVHIYWDLPIAIPEHLLHQFEALGRDTGYHLIVCREPALTEDPS